MNDSTANARIELARRNFYYFCKLMAPSFYTNDRTYLYELCSELQEFFYSEKEVCVINMPPRHGKSRTAALFAEWILGKNVGEKIMTGSYNERLSGMFSKSVREAIKEKKTDKRRFVYSDVFPGTKIHEGTKNLWSVEGGYNNYLASSPSGTATGFGCSLMIIDDLIKNALEAYNENVLEGQWQWFTNTMLSRLEENGKIVIIMTRWASGDLAGRVLTFFAKSKVLHLCYKAYNGTDMLCPSILSYKSYHAKLKLMGSEIASANYQQEPIDIKGRLYTSFKTYTKLPQFTMIKNYTDTADLGKDYLCSINYGILSGEAYVINVLYTKEPMTVTEPALARMLYQDKVNVADIESNNGGGGFARSVKAHLQNDFHSNFTVIHPFVQHKNKEARILSNATFVMEHIYFPSNWQEKYTEFYNAMTLFLRVGKNKHDDAADAITGVAERLHSAYSFE